jgi:hypothetical protein
MKQVGGWVSDVFEKYAVIYKDRKLYKVPYTREKDEISFAEMAEWKEVKPTRQFVEKHADKLFSVKSFEQDGETYLDAYGILWGDATQKDLHGEYFTPETDELMAIFKQMGALPWLFNHAADGTLKSVVVGKVQEMGTDDIGLWYRTKVAEHEVYRKYVEPLVKSKKLFSSSGTLPAAKRVTKSGQITRWPIVEMTGTHRPAEHRMLNVPISEVNKYFDSIGLPGLDQQSEVDGGGSEKGRKMTELALEQQRLALKLKQIQFNLEGD